MRRYEYSDEIVNVVKQFLTEEETGFYTKTHLHGILSLLCDGHICAAGSGVLDFRAVGMADEG